VEALIPELIGNAPDTLALLRAFEPSVYIPKKP
jgi:hypothetical protein